MSKKVGLRLTGAGGGEWTISTTKPDVQITVTDGIAADVAATITWLTTDLVLWATRRKPWRAAQVTVDGDNLYASIVLDAIHLF